MLEVRGLSAGYGHAQALWDVSITVNEGETVCIVGPNGAGKTTLVNSIAGVHRATAGQVLLNGIDLTTVAPHRICDHGVAIVPEGRRVFPSMTVRDNLLLGAHRRGARRTRSQAEEEVTALFPRLAERTRQLAGSLSGGEQQMVALGRALMARPKVLLLDEPSLGLAPVVVDEVFDALSAVATSGVAVLLVEQDVYRALDAADRGYLLIEGRVVSAGSADDLRSSDQVRQRVLGVDR